MPGEFLARFEVPAGRGRTADQAPTGPDDLACGFPSLTLLNLGLDDWLSTLTPVIRTFMLATIAVPIVIYGLMPSCTGFATAS